MPEHALDDNEFSYSVHAMVHGIIIAHLHVHVHVHVHACYVHCTCIQPLQYNDCV